MLDIDKGAICDGDDTGSRMPANISKRLYLLQVYIVHACTLFQDSVCGLVQVFMIIDEVSQERPFVIEFFQVGFDEQYLQFIVVKTKNDTIDGNPDDAIAFQL